MSGIETAIRNALSKSDRSDADVRARIYQSARNAVDAGLRKQGISDPQLVETQHRLLENLISRIEVEEQQRLQPAIDDNLFDFAPEPLETETAPPVDAPAAESRRPEPSDLGGMRAERPDAPRKNAKPPRTEPSEKPTPPSEADERKLRKKRRGAGIIASLLVYGLILVAVGGGGWWLLHSGLIEQIKAVSNGERVSQTQSADRVDADAQFRGLRTLDPSSGFGKDWIDVLKPGQMNGVEHGSGAAAEAVSTSEGPAVRISSQDSNDSGVTNIAVPETVLQQMSGKVSTIALTLQSSGNEPVQIAIECDFGALGACGRHRFTVNHDKSDILLQVVFDRTAPPATPGKLKLMADLQGKGRGVNLFAVRVQPGE